MKELINKSMNINDKEYEKENPFDLEIDSDFHKTRENTTLSIIKEFSRSKGEIRLLDVGCGRGKITKRIKQIFRNCDIDAIDISQNSINKANINNMNIHFEIANAEEFTGYGYKYDIIILNNIYEHVENPLIILNNLKKMITQRCILFISTPNRFSTRNILRILFGVKVPISKYHITEYSLGQIEDHLKYVGLKLQRVIFPKFKRENMRILDFIITFIIRPLADAYFKLIKSNTRLGNLMFLVINKE